MVKLDIPEGYEVDVERTTPDNIVLRPISIKPSQAAQAYFDLNITNGHPFQPTYGQLPKWKTPEGMRDDNVMPSREYSDLISDLAELSFLVEYANLKFEKSNNRYALKFYLEKDKSGDELLDHAIRTLTTSEKGNLLFTFTSTAAFYWILDNHKEFYYSVCSRLRNLFKILEVKS